MKNECYLTAELQNNTKPFHITLGDDYRPGGAWGGIAKAHLVCDRTAGVRGYKSIWGDGVYGRPRAANILAINWTKMTVDPIKRKRSFLGINPP